MADGYTVKYETHIPAPRATVFAFLLDPDKLIRWIGHGAEMDPHPGGIYLLKEVAGAHTARGAFKEVVPVHRLAYSFGWDEPRGSAARLEPGRDRSRGTRRRHAAALHP